MGRPDGAHTHGGGHGLPTDWRIYAIVAATVVIVAGGGASGLISQLNDLIYWTAGVVGAAVIVVAAMVTRAFRKGWRRDYIKSVHGATARDREIDQMAALRREIALARAARYQLEVARRMEGDYTPIIEHIHPNLVQYGSITGRIAPPEWPQPGVPHRMHLTSGLTQELPPIPGHES